MILFSIWLTAAACTGNRAGKMEGAGNYYDIKGLVLGQMKILPGSGLYLLKKASVDKDTSETRMKPDLTEWLLELENLAGADINKPRLAGSYQTVFHRQGDSVSITEYISLEPQKTYVDRLTIIKKPAVLTIQALIKNENALFAAAKHLSYRFRLTEGNFLFSGYDVRGWQKIIAFDTVRYNLQARVTNR